MNISWTPTANKSYEYIMTCATDYYSKNTLRKLVSSIKQAERLLYTNPQIGSIEPLTSGREFQYRSYILSSPFKLIYTVYGDTIYIADIWDTRQSPETLTSKLK